jgi:hypothetical protein
MGRLRAYRILCAGLGVLFVLAGCAMVFAFFRASFPGGDVPGPIPLGPGGVYFVAFTGCALVGWGGGLLGAARQPEAGRTVGTATAFALVLMALYRILGWLMGDYAYLGDVLRGEAVFFLVLALAFVWLRPTRPDALAGTGVAR